MRKAFVVSAFVVWGGGRRRSVVASEAGRVFRIRLGKPSNPAVCGGGLVAKIRHGFPVPLAADGGKQTFGLTEPTPRLRY